MINALLDYGRPYRALEAGDDPEYLEQGGFVYVWSDSNVRYERAWWLDKGVKESALVRRIREARPLPGRTHGEVISAMIERLEGAAHGD